MQVFFDNGDFISLHGESIIDLSLNLYDKLIWADDKICSVAESGQIVFDLANRATLVSRSAFVCDEKSFRADPFGFAIHRLCNEGGVNCIELFDLNHQSETIYASVIAESNDSFLTLRFLPKTISEPSDGDYCTINLNHVTKHSIDQIELSFENCDLFSIYSDEILDLNLELSNELTSGSGCYQREIINGYIKLKFNSNQSDRSVGSFFSKGKSVSVNKLKSRLCQPHDITIHDLCHLYIHYDYAGYGAKRCECLDVEDIQDPLELERLFALEEETGKEHYIFQGGCCKRLPDGSIWVAFGNTARNMLTAR